VTGQIKKVKPRGRYPEELKRKIAKEYLAGKASAGYLAEEHGLKNKGVVKEFVKWYLRKDELCVQNQDAMSDKKASTEAASDLSAQERLKQLKRQLELSQLKVEALETMIDLAEKEFQIEIRKKSGAKQSKR
jgi:transposase-like protein